MARRARQRHARGDSCAWRPFLAYGRASAAAAPSEPARPWWSPGCTACEQNSGIRAAGATARSAAWNGTRGLRECGAGGAPLICFRSLSKIMPRTGSSLDLTTSVLLIQHDVLAPRRKKRPIIACPLEDVPRAGTTCEEAPSPPWRTHSGLPFSSFLTTFSNTNVHHVAFLTAAKIARARQSVSPKSCMLDAAARPIVLQRHHDATRRNRKNSRDSPHGFSL